jgi:hypothetical protein
MNTCGFEMGLTSKFIEKDEDLNELLKDFFFSQLYPILKSENLFTPVSYIFNYNDLFNGKIDDLISKLPNKKCFSRLDILSTKPNKPYTCSQEIITDFKKSHRTK